MASLEELIEERKRKLDNLKEEGIDPYPARVAVGISINDIIKNFASYKRENRSVRVNARIMGIRKQGGLIFLDLQQEGARLQALLKKNALKNFKLLKSNLDIGDFVSLRGKPFLTKSKEKTIDVNSAQIIVKSIRPLPATWYGLKDIEERYRRRYLDLLLNREADSLIRKRSEFLLSLRKILDKEEFIEVETPTLQSVAGGAAARPFETDSNALDMDLYLRIAQELPLKRMLVAGWERVYEIGKVFRNEGVDREHNPEFTLLELYWAYQDYDGMMKFVEKLIRTLAKAVKIKDIRYNDKKVSLKKPWPRVTFNSFISKYAGIDIESSTAKEVNKFMKQNKILAHENQTKYELADEIFKKMVRPKIINPTFVIHHPKEISPLSKSRPEKPDETERFQLVIAGREVVNGFSELNDAVDQRERMELQEEYLRKGNEEVSRLDEDFIEALEYGMPPAAGIGIGLDRLIAIFTNTHSIRDVIAFPLLKPKE